MAAGNNSIIYEDIKKKILANYSTIEQMPSRDNKIKSYADELTNIKEVCSNVSNLKMGGVGCAAKLCPDSSAVSSSEFLTTVSYKWGFGDKVYVYNRNGKGDFEKVDDVIGLRSYDRNICNDQIASPATPEFLQMARRAVDRVQRDISVYFYELFCSDPVGWTVPVLLLKDKSELTYLGANLYKFCGLDERRELNIRQYVMTSSL